MFRKNSDQLAQILEIYYGLSFRLFGKKRNIFLKQKWVWHQFEYTIIKELNSSLRGSKGFSIAHVLYRPPNVLARRGELSARRLSPGGRWDCRRP